MKKLPGIVLCIVLLLSACTASENPSVVLPLTLAHFEENHVDVAILLEIDQVGQAWLSATFTPEAGKHLYSMDLPKQGVNGLGRPTRLELIPGTKLNLAGELTESVTAFEDPTEEGLMIYPDGAVTLSLPIVLPDGSGWYDERISVTYMACANGTCYPPVLEKQIEIQVPGGQEIDP